MNAEYSEVLKSKGIAWLPSTQEEFVKQLADKEVETAYQIISRLLIKAEEEESGAVPSEADKIVQNLLLENLAFLKKQYNEVSYGC